MRTGQRIAERRTALGLSQAKLARLSGVSQGTIGKLEAGISHGSSHLHTIAQHLGTTPAYLAGQTDDPNEGAPPPPPPAPMMLMMQVVLPSEDALAEMFAAILSVSRDMTEHELARELAKRLPIGLELAQRVKPTYHQAFADDAEEPAGAPHTARRTPRQASGK